MSSELFRRHRRGKLSLEIAAVCDRNSSSTVRCDPPPLASRQRRRGRPARQLPHLRAQPLRAPRPALTGRVLVEAGLLAASGNRGRAPRLIPASHSTLTLTASALDSSPPRTQALPHW